jgi:DNA polymerase III epsilon subunit-like protein
MSNEFNVMIDLETLSQAKTAAVVSIGAVKFTDDRIIDSFYVNISPQSTKDLGLHISTSTIEWWKTQKPEAYAALRQSRKDAHTALDEFIAWYGNTSVPTWANGPDFDLVILEHMMHKCEKKVPWEFWHARCFRTFKNLFVDRSFKLEGVAHNALDDATHQAKYIQHIMSKAK